MFAGTRGTAHDRAYTAYPRSLPLLAFPTIPLVGSRGYHGSSKGRCTMRKTRIVPAALFLAAALRRHRRAGSRDHAAGEQDLNEHDERPV